MSDPNQIKPNVNPGRLTLFAGWVLFFVVPSIALFQVLGAYFIATEVFQKNQLRQRMVGELRRFQQELDPKEYVDTSLNQAFSRILLKNSTPFKIGAEKSLLKNLEKTLEFPLIGFGWHSPDLKEIGFKGVGKERFLFHKFVLKLLFRKLYFNFQKWSASKDFHQQQLSEEENKTLLNGARGILGDTSRCEFSGGRIHVLYSKKFSVGRIIMFYRYFQGIGGCLAFVRERDLSPEKIMCKVRSISAGNGLRRKISFVPTIESEENPLFFAGYHTGFRNTPKEFQLTGLPPAWFQSLLVHRGTLVPTHLQRFIKSPPLLQIVARPELFLSPIRKHIPLLKGMSRLFCLFGAALMLYLGLFGLEFSASVQQKILLGAVLLGCIPLAALWISGSVRKDVGDLQERFLVQTNLSTKFQEIGQRLVEYRARQQRQNLRLRKALEEDPVQSSQSRKKIIESWMTTQPILFAGVTDKNGSGSFLINPLKKKARLDKDVVGLLGLASKTAMKMLLSTNVESKEFASNAKFSGVDFNANVLSRGMEIQGDLVFVPLGLGNWMSAGLTAFNKGNRLRPELSILMVFPLDMILRDFFKDFRLSSPGDEDREGKWEFDLQAILLRSNDNGECIQELWRDSKSLRGVFPEEFPTNAMTVDGLVMEKRTSDYFGVQMFQIIPKIPCLLRGVGVLRRPSQWTSATMVILYGILYGGWLYFLLGENFIRPVDSLARAAAIIEKGGQPETSGLPSGGDELGAMGNAFREMTVTLRHREELARFVSDDVRMTVTDQSVERIDPGGELCEATVLFASLRGFQDWAVSRDPEEAVQVLGKFLEIGDSEIRRAGGNLDKILEDTLMGVFRANDGETQNHAYRACAAGFALQKRLEEASASFPTELIACSKAAIKKSETQDAAPQQPYQVKMCHIGLASGKVVSGLIGSRRGKLDQTVIGNAVNLAARIKGQAELAKTTGILIAPSTVRFLPGKAGITFAGRIPIKGRSRTFPLYEVLELRGGQTKR